MNILYEDKKIGKITDTEVIFKNEERVNLSIIAKAEFKLNSSSLKLIFIFVIFITACLLNIGFGAYDAERTFYVLMIPVTRLNVWIFFIISPYHLIFTNKNGGKFLTYTSPIGVNLPGFALKINFAIANLANNKAQESGLDVK